MQRQRTNGQEVSGLGDRRAWRAESASRWWRSPSPRGVRRAETIDRVLAVVGGQLIMLSDVTAALDLGLVSADGAADPVGAVLAKLIDRELVLAEVDRYAPPEPAARGRRSRVGRACAGVSHRAAAFDAGFDARASTEKHLRETLRQDLRIRAYIAQRFAGAEDDPAGRC